jgi:hypothetical protein
MVTVLGFTEGSQPPCLAITHVQYFRVNPLQSQPLERGHVVVPRMQKTGRKPFIATANGSCLTQTRQNVHMRKESPPYPAAPLHWSTWHTGGCTSFAGRCSSSRCAPGGGRTRCTAECSLHRRGLGWCSWATERRFRWGCSTGRRRWSWPTRWATWQ